MSKDSIARIVTSIVVGALTQLALIGAYCALFGAISSWLAMFIALALSLCAADVVCSYWETTGYDATVAATVSTVTAVRGWFGAVRTKVAA